MDALIDQIAADVREARDLAKAHAPVLVNILDRLDISNGNLADLRKDFDASKLEEATRAGHMEGALDTMRSIVQAALVASAATGTISGVVFGIIKLTS